MNFIIAGTAKAATSSVFSYLSAHPQVCGSSIKETAFFQRECTGSPEVDRIAYSRYFSHCNDANRIFMEASPGYLVCGDEVMQAIKAMLPDVRLLFILRNPVDRLYSYYNFQVEQFRIPRNITFGRFVDMCAQYDVRGEVAGYANLQKWHLVQLRTGRYAEYLSRYIELFGIERIKVMFFEHLKLDPRVFMRILSEFLQIYPSFYQSYEFHRVNVTFSAQLKVLHKLAIHVDTALEKHLRQRPRLKRALVTAYKFINRAKEGYRPMDRATMNRLERYYRKSNEKLRELIAGQGELPEWLV
ncbi:MAG: hypothetical protein BA863_00110 [Desulfovibrio sp. S3730MH75]|nr:MAG: hypothetical protein BA863_00110 [Desulfovibrio sp. S3730MH75]